MSDWLPKTWGKLGIKAFCQCITKSFFRERNIIGAQRVPAYGPIIYFGNHSNQFVDAAVFIASLPRYPRFLIAAVSMHAPVIGDLARVAGAIPVARPGDSQFNGLGIVKVTKENSDENGKFTYTIEGEGSSFQADNIKPRDQIVINVDKVKYTFNVEEVTFKDNGQKDIAIVSCTTNGLLKLLGNTGHSYKVVPKMNQSQAYEAVTKTLAEGSSIGIFPEGGSHDNPNLLPLKPGIAVMALNAAAQGIKNIMLVPCGIHYSNPAKVMSSYTVEINKPIVITDDLVEEYKKDKRVAVSTVMELVKNRLEEVTITAGDQDEFECIQIARQLYPPEGHVCKSNEVQTEITHILERCFREYRNRVEMQALNESLLTYRDLLNQYNAQDRNVCNLRLNSSEAFIHCLEALPSFFFSFFIAAFSSPLWGPARCVSSYYADMKRNAALKKSTVKVRGSDVVASHKLIFLLVLFPVLMMSWSICFGLFIYGTFQGVLWSIIAGFMIQPGVYYFGIKEADRLTNKLDELVSLVGVIIHDLTTWRRNRNILLQSREATVLKLRATLSALLNEDSEFAKKQKDRLSFIFPQEVIDIDTTRIQSSINGSSHEAYDASEWVQDLVGFAEEIL